MVRALCGQKAAIPDKKGVAAFLPYPQGVRRICTPENLATYAQ